MIDPISFADILYLSSCWLSFRGPQNERGAYTAMRASPIATSDCTGFRILLYQFRSGTAPAFCTPNRLALLGPAAWAKLGNVLLRKHLDRLARNAAALLGSEVQPELLSQRVYNLCFSALQHLMPCDTDCMLTVLVPTSNRSTLASLYLHVKRLDSKVSGKATSACNVALVGHARNQPWIKDSEWVHERQPIEAIKPDGCAEAILSINAQGETLLEGLTCNFFIVQYNSCINGYELHTAPVSIRSESTGVLDGTIRSTIVQNARPWLDIPVVERAPRASEAQYWEEVFITSAIRIVSPVERVTLLHSHQSETHKQEDLWVASVGCYNKESSHIQHFYANKLKSMLFHYQDDDAVISIDKPKSFSE